MENVLHIALRPFGFDTFVEMQGTWFDLASHHWGFETSKGQFPSLEVWAGPLYLVINRT